MVVPSTMLLYDGATSVIRIRRRNSEFSEFTLEFDILAL